MDSEREKERNGEEQDENGCTERTKWEERDREVREKEKNDKKKERKKRGMRHFLPDSAHKPEEQEKRKVRRQRRRETEQSIDDERGDQTRSPPGNVRPASPHVTADHHPQEDDGVQGAFLHAGRMKRVVARRVIDDRDYERDALDLDRV